MMLTEDRGRVGSLAGFRRFTSAAPLPPRSPGTVMDGTRRGFLG